MRLVSLAAATAAVAPAAAIQQAKTDPQQQQHHHHHHQQELLLSIAQGLLVPSMPLSSAAAAAQASALAMQQQQLEQQEHHTVPSITSSAQPQAAGDLVRSLPLELLYDDEGLRLFDQLTRTPEYYLTAAEASILEAWGADIVAAAVPDDTLLLELGAGSLVKTRLLLDAVASAGRQGVSFAALDLCAASLSGALQPLQERYQGSINLVGWVGTYQQGLRLLQGEGHANTKDGLGSNSSSSGCINMMVQDDQTGRGTPALSSQANNNRRCNSAGSSSTSAAAPLQEPEHGVHASGHGGSSSSSSSNNGSNNGSSSQPCSPPNSSSPVVPPHRSRVILWLGSSIGNCSRDEAVAFLRAVQRQAMRPGDCLLVGIDRRNPPAKVAAAYNDSQGAMRALILNGLQHCRRLLNDQQLLPPPPHPAAPGHRSSEATAAAAAPHCGAGLLGCPANGVPAGSCCQAGGSALDPAAFDYLGLYNSQLGRHEAFYRARHRTTIRLPAALANQAAAAVAAAGEPCSSACADGTTAAASGSSTDVPQAAVPARAAAAAAGQAAAVHDAGYMDVPIAARELVHIADSHKYSEEEVQQLAAAAGLVRLQAWSDAQQQFGLHLLAAA